MSDRLLDAAAIAGLLDEVASELPDDEQRTLLLVDGALLAWHALRKSTPDVDSGHRIDEVVADSVERVGRRRGLSPRWLNDSAAANLPAGVDTKRCDILVDRASLRVLGLPLDQLLLMKLNASRASDTDGIEALWPHCSYPTAEAAAEAFYDAYPLEARDPYLADHLRTII